MTAFWKEAHDEGALAWDDSNNNRAFLSARFAQRATRHRFTSRACARPTNTRPKRVVRSRTTSSTRPLSKRAGWSGHLPHGSSHMVMGYSKNQRAAKDFLRWAGSKDVYEKWFKTQKGFSVGATRQWSEHRCGTRTPSCSHSGTWFVTQGVPRWPGPASGSDFRSCLMTDSALEGRSRHERRGRGQLGARRIGQDLGSI